MILIDYIIIFIIIASISLGFLRGFYQELISIYFWFFNFCFFNKYYYFSSFYYNSMPFFLKNKILILIMIIFFLLSKRC
ncbi:hypothetical protein D9V59_00825 [Buchnera aphidicola (Artemisaphis artemisicola)]|uniref:Colicin V production protein n=1 Tax=Buchnera aphidicola (Artemisaphis artemisicola) TaxID=1241836 RepID=A0A4D6XJ48_9GAMM|nr:hypothetical protein D9V59_00825 [Buchnera aphidicola (Artemisaphis artemisicola)]